VKESIDARGVEPKGYVEDVSSASSLHHIDGVPAEILNMYPEGISRRRFLSLLSASAALAMGASCSRIDRGSVVPYTKHPGNIQPGVAAYYASTFQEGLYVQGILVKTREGRPIHIEGNPEHPVSRGTVGLRAMGDLLGLYDPDRLRAPMFQGASATWDAAVTAMTQALKNARVGEKNVLLVTGAVISPSQNALIGEIKSAVPGLQHVCWEPCAPHAEYRAMSSIHRKAITPRLNVNRADVILSLYSDFLGNDGNVPQAIRDFSSRRGVSVPGQPPLPPMNRLWVFEGPMTLTGANADERILLRPSLIAPLAYSLIQLLHKEEEVPLPEGLHPEDLKSFEPERIAESLAIKPDKLKLLATDLAHARKKALVLAGPSLSEETHIACHLLNVMLEAEGNTIDFDKGIRFPDMLSSEELRGQFEEAAEGKFSAAIFWGVNPAYAFPGTSLWERAVADIPETFRIGLYKDETALDCNWSLPEHHWLESWGDFRSASDYVSLRQPTIGPLHNTRQGEDLLLACAQNMGLQVPGSYLEYMKSRWKVQVYSEDSPVAFEDYWNAALHNGGAQSKSELSAGEPSGKEEAIRNALKTAAEGLVDKDSERMELVLFTCAGVYDGRYTNNGWLNELPDPVSKVTWGNPMALSIQDADRIGVKNGDVVEVFNGETTIESPVMVQPGQCEGVAAMALGYGRQTGNVAAGIGVNAYPMLGISLDSLLHIPEVRIRHRSTSGKQPISFTQTHGRMEGRDLARSWTLAAFEQSFEKEEHKEGSHHASLVPERKFPGHKWSMAVDLSACVGCSACVIACQSENNVPVVGPERVVLEGRHMHWIRIDRYYEGNSLNPTVVHQPMFCQHCDDAPCEIVCPVNATTHSPDGLNQMTYNRCVGTRYCSNNCPFKVRRFNFFDYTSMKKEPESLVFNPEVTVRPRGVMEKCTFCIQRIQNAKQKAKVEDRLVKDGDIVPACAGACPAGAIVFGDLNDPDSRLARLSKTGRTYKMLEEFGIKPSVTYLADISNPAVGEEKA